MSLSKEQIEWLLNELLNPFKWNDSPIRKEIIKELRK